KPTRRPQTANAQPIAPLVGLTYRTAVCGTRLYGGVAGCVKKTRKRHAVRKMKVGPSEPLCRGRLQTAVSCFSQKAAVVNVTVKRRGIRSRHVGIRETNVNEPPTTHRNTTRTT